jgi:hypothetical protein
MNTVSIVPAESKQGVNRDVRRLRRWLKHNPRKPPGPGPRARRITNDDRARIVGTVGRLGKIARCKQNPYVGREDMIQEGVLVNLEAARCKGADLSPDRCVRRAGIRMNAVARQARREFPGRLAADLIPGSDGLTPLDRAAEDEALTYGRGPIGMRATLDVLMKRLPRRERLVLVLRFGLDGRPPLVREDIAWALGISDTHVNTIESRAVARLRELAQGSAALDDAA